MTDVAISPMGMGALLLDAAGAVFSEPVQARIHAVAAILRAREEMQEVVPGMNNLLVCFDPVATDPAAAERLLRQLWSRAEVQNTPTGKTVEIPVTYGGAAATDLQLWAAHCGLTVAEAIRRHAEGRMPMFSMRPTATKFMSSAEPPYEKNGSVTPVTGRRPSAPPTFTLPPLDWLALRSLDDGEQVWVVHHADDDVDVLAADVLYDENSVVTGLSHLVFWYAPSDSFVPGRYDSHGTAAWVAGGTYRARDRLDGYAFTREGDALIVGERVPGFPRAAIARPVLLAGPFDEPYADRTPVPVARLVDYSPGQVVVVDGEIHADESGAVLCTSSSDVRLRIRHHAPPCDAPSFPVFGVRVALPGEDWRRIRGPFVVRWRGDAVDRVIYLGGNIQWGTS